jgi:hypothetical protein
VCSGFFLLFEIAAENKELGFRIQELAFRMIGGNKLFILNPES